MVFFQGHACLWKRQALLNIAPVSQWLNGESILTEDIYASFRVSRLGLQGRADGTPSAFWVPATLNDLGDMFSRWYQGTLQCYAKDAHWILSRGMGYGDAGTYVTIWYRLWRPFRVVSADPCRAVAILKMGHVACCDSVGAGLPVAALACHGIQV